MDIVQNIVLGISKKLTLQESCNYMKTLKLIVSWLVILFVKVFIFSYVYRIHARQEDILVNR